MKTYITIPARYLAGRKLRTLLTTLAVVFGVAVIFAVNMLLPALSGALAASEMGATGHVDLTVASAVGGTFDAGVLDKVSGTAGVAASSPAFLRQIVLPATSGKPQFDLLGLDPARAQTVRIYQVSAGRFLNAGDTLSAVLSQGLAQATGLHVGDAFTLPTPGGLSNLSIVGVYNDAGADQLLVPLKTAQQLFGAPGQITAVDVVITNAAERDTVKGALAGALGSAYNVGSAAANSAFTQSLQLGLVISNVFGILALFMGAFLVFNTFRTLVVERRHDIGMLRAVGATRGTIVRLILVESALQGVIGTAIGLALGYLLGLGLMGALQGLFSQYVRLRLGPAVVPPEAVILSVGLGVGVTVLAGLLPAITAGRMSVLASLRQDGGVPTGERSGRMPIMVGAVLLIVGVVTLFLGNISLATVGSLLILTGLVLLAPVLLIPITRLLEPVTRRVFACEGLLASGNVKRNPGRAAITVSALMIALAVIVGLAAVLSSLQQAYTGKLAGSLGADILLLPPNLGVWNANVGVGPEFEQQLAQIPGIGAVAGLSYAPALVQGAGVQVLGFDPASYPKVASLIFDQGGPEAYAEIAGSRSVIANSRLASGLQLKVGDSIAVQTPAGAQHYGIAAIGTDYLGAKISTLYISKQNMARDFGQTADIIVFSNLAQHADSAAVRANVEKLLQGYPQLTFNWGADWRKEQVAILDQTFTALYIVLAALIIPSMLGLINTLAINVLERTREIGVLRAIGATRSQIRRIVLVESLILGATGTALGLLAGLALGYSLTAVVGSTFTSSAVFYFPLGGILFAIALALVMALLASILPARQAARVKIVQALQYE